MLPEPGELKSTKKKLSELLDVPVVFTVGNKNKGIDTLLEKAIELAESDDVIPIKRKVKYSKDIEDSISKLEHFIEGLAEGSIPYSIRWTAIKLIEDDKIVKEHPTENRKKRPKDS